jgi:hypothetical protein
MDLGAAPAQVAPALPSRSQVLGLDNDEVRPADKQQVDLEEVLPSGYRLQRGMELR